MIRLAETRGKLIAVDLDDTFTDHTGAFREVLAQLGVNVPDGMPETANYVGEGWFDSRKAFEAYYLRVIKLGLYLRERPLTHAVESLNRLTIEVELEAFLDY